MRRALIAVCSLAFLLAIPVLAAEEDSIRTTVQEVLEETPLIDGHNDAPWAIRSRWSNQLDSVRFSRYGGW